MIPPCKGCLLVPLCKHRKYIELFTRCSLLRMYILNPCDRFKRNNLRVEMLNVVLRPSGWFYNREGYVYNHSNMKSI
jgi:hypothetical protein